MKTPEQVYLDKHVELRQIGLMEPAAHSGALQAAVAWARETDPVRKELEEEVERLKACLEPGKSLAIVNGMWTLAKRLQMPHSSWKHCLTWFGEEITRLREENKALAQAKEEKTK